MILDHFLIFNKGGEQKSQTVDSIVERLPKPLLSNKNYSKPYTRPIGIRFHPPPATLLVIGI